MQVSCNKDGLCKKGTYNPSPTLKVGSYFRLGEFVKSSIAKQCAIDNSIPDKNVLDNICKLCSEILDPIRSCFKSSVCVSSGYRCHELNRRVGGVPNSRHMSGCAADITAGDFNRLVACVQGLVELKYISPTELIYHDNYIHIAL